MGSKRSKQLVILKVDKGRIPFLPEGDYEVYVDDVYIEGGSITLKARVLTSAVMQEEEVKK